MATPHWKHLEEENEHDGYADDCAPGRWTWPAEATRLTGWLEASELADLTSDPQPTLNHNRGRKLWFFPEGQERRRTVLERRSEWDSWGRAKHEYRFVCARSLEAIWEDLSPTYTFNNPAPSLLETWVETSHPWQASPTLCVRSNYHPLLPPEYRARRGTWDIVERVWKFHDESTFDELASFWRAFYGLEDGRRFDVRLSPPFLTILTRDLLEQARRWCAFSRLVAQVDPFYLCTGPGAYFLDDTKAYDDPNKISLVVEGVPSSVYERFAASLEDVIGDVCTASDTRPSHAHTMLPRELVGLPIGRVYEAAEAKPPEPPYGDRDNFFF